LITFNIVRLRREGDEPWVQNISTVRLYPLMKNQMTALLQECGFTNLRFYGIMDEAAFDPLHSENLVAVAQKV
jgi:hypothetical protein